MNYGRIIEQSEVCSKPSEVSNKTFCKVNYINVGNNYTCLSVLGN